MCSMGRVNWFLYYSITQNRSEKERTVQAVLSAASIYYTGIKAHVIKKATGDFKVGPKASEYSSYFLSITASPFIRLLFTLSLGGKT